MQEHRVHRGQRLHAAAQAQHRLDVAAVRLVRAVRAAEHPVGVAHADHHRADQRQPPAHLDLGELFDHAVALGQPQIFGPIGAESRIVLGIDHLEMGAHLEPQAIAFDTLRDDRGAADQDRLGEPLVDDDLHRAQHAFVLALGEYDAPRRFLRRLEDRLHQQS